MMTMMVFFWFGSGRLRNFFSFLTIKDMSNQKKKMFKSIGGGLDFFFIWWTIFSTIVIVDSQVVFSHHHISIFGNSFFSGWLVFGTEEPPPKIDLLTCWTIFTSFFSYGKIHMSFCRGTRFLRMNFAYDKVVFFLDFFSLIQLRKKIRFFLVTVLFLIDFRNQNNVMLSHHINNR